MKRNDQLALLLDRRTEEERRKLNMAVNDFRSLHQQPQSRREWDLYDPDSLKKDLPARVADDDPRCTISGAQKFEGEDHNAKARIAMQQEQARNWWTQQKQNKELSECNQKEADRLYQLKMMELDQRAIELAKAEEECRRALNVANSNYNDALARETSARRAIKKQQEQDDNMTELANQIFSDLLCENPAQARSLWGPNRVVPDRWKGMSPEQLEEVKRIQADQIAEKARKEEEARLEAEEADRQRLIQARAAILLEREAERARKEIDRRVAEENNRLAREQKGHQEYLTKEVYTNAPTASYYMQWNTTTR